MKNSATMLSRRQLLQAGGAGLLTMTVPGTVAARVDGKVVVEGTMTFALGLRSEGPAASDAT